MSISHDLVFGCAFCEKILSLISKYQWLQGNTHKEIIGLQIMLCLKLRPQIKTYYIDHDATNGLIRMLDVALKNSWKNMV